MIWEYALTSPTPVPAGSGIPFNEKICGNGCAVRNRTGSAVLNLKGGTCCKPNQYLILFNANVTGTTGAIELQLFADGEPIPETQMRVLTTTATDIVTANTSTVVCVERCCVNLSARVTLGTGVTVNNANIIVQKEVG